MEFIDELMAGAAVRASRMSRPLVTLSYAQSLDGSLSALQGEGLALSCAESRRLTHRLRAANAAILVGIGTVLADDPSLSARLVGGPHPQPVVLDRRLRIPPEARLVQCRELPPWVFCGPEAPGERQGVLEALGVRVLRVNLSSWGGLDLNLVLGQLARLGIASLMVEGGGRVISSFLKERLADQAMLTIAPVWVGGWKSINEGLGRRMVYPALGDPHYEQVGRDLVVWGRIGEERYESSGAVFYRPAAG